MGITGIMRLMAVALAAVCCVATAAPKQAGTIDVWLKGSVGIDESGRVVALEWQPRSKMHELIAARLTPLVRSWEYEPATADGKSAATQTGLLVHVLVDERDDGSVMLRLADAKTGPTAATLAPPRYPGEAARYGISAQVKVTVEVEADGSPVIREMTFESSRRKHSKRDRDAFIASATQAVATWTFIPEVVAGHAVRESVTIPIEYCMQPSDWCKRLREKEDARSAARKMPAGLHMGASSAVALKTDIREQVI